MLNKHGFGYAWKNQVTWNVSHFEFIFRKCLEDEYLQTWQVWINTCNKALFYKLFGNETFLDLTKTKANRRGLSKCHLSLGRWRDRK